MKNLFILVCIFLGFYSIFTHKSYIDFEDKKLKTALVNHQPSIDLNNDGEIQYSEAERVTHLNLSDKEITSISGLGNFVNLEKIDCHKINLDSTELKRLVHLENINYKEEVSKEDLKYYTEN